MNRRPTTPGVVLGMVALLVGACSGDDSTDRSSSEVATSSSDPGDALEPVEPVEAPTSTTAPTAAPTTTFPEPQLPERMAQPNPNWDAVDIPSGEPLAPATPQQLLVDPASQVYDISPDGAYLARLDPAAGLCLSSTADLDDQVCNDSIELNFATWAPDSSMVLFNYMSWTQGRSGPLGTLGADGTVTDLVESTAPDEPIGGAASAGFVDADTVLYNRLVPGPAWTFEVHTVEIDGSDDRVLGSLDMGVAPNAFVNGIDLVDGTSLYIQGTTRAGGGNGIWRYDAESDAFGRIVADPDSTDGPQGVGSAPVAVSGGLLLSVESVRFSAFTSNQDEGRFFDLTTTDAVTSVPVLDLDDDYMILGAALSPDGAHLAVYERYRGDDRAIADSASNARVSIAATASIMNGEPTWFTVTGVGPSLTSRNLDRSGTSITWPSPDRLHLELLDGAYAFDVVPV